MVKKRREHLIKRLKGNQVPDKFIFFDTETKTKQVKPKKKEHLLKLGWACYWRKERKGHQEIVEYFYFEKADKFWEWAESKLTKGKALYLIAHNITYDFTIVKGFKYLFSKNFKVGSFYNKYQTVIIRFHSGNKSLYILDNLNFFRGKLEDLGCQVGIEKIPIDFATCTKQELSQHCKRDVEIMHKTWVKYLSYLKEKNLGSFSLTVPAQAFKSYRHRFMNCYITVHAEERVSTIERKAYFGGRNECFYLGKVPSSPVHILDVNSMYPFVMKKYEYPCRLSFLWPNSSGGQLVEALENYACIAHVKVETDLPVYPLKSGAVTFYPVGSFDTVLSTPELLFGLEHDLIKEVYSLVTYKKANLFKDYVDYFYKKKLQAKKRGDQIEERFAKLMLNSLYGKFGQLATEWRKIGEANPDEVWVEQVKDAETGRWDIWYAFGGCVYEVTRTKESYHSFPAICAHVTAAARMFLWSLIELAGRENVYYVDTDCLFVNSKGHRRLLKKMHPKKLGYLSERGRIENAIIFGCKDYILDDLVVMKGIRSTAKQIDKSTFEQEQWSTFMSLFWQGDLNRYYVKDIKKTLYRDYDKGSVTSCGKVIPFSLEEQFSFLPQAPF